MQPSLVRNALCCLLFCFVALFAGCSSSTSPSTTTAPVISVAIVTPTITIASGGSSNVTATVSNDGTNAGVTWNLSPNTGTLSNVTPSSVTYTAPASLATGATVSLTATSIKDTTKSATATITITAAPPVSVAISPATITLTDGASQAFSVTVTNDSTNSGVTWSIGTGVGLLSGSTTTSATYNAPAGLPGSGEVTLTATSIKDPTRSASASITLTAPPVPASQWVYYNSSGLLAYKSLDTQGDKIMDFSTAGYGGGAVAIPTATVIVNVAPSGGDDTATIQAALNSAATMTLNSTTGLRGAVLLAPGSYTVSKTLTMTASGVVLRGSGSGTSPASNTVITMATATTPYALFTLGSSTASPSNLTQSAITDTYVAADSLTIDVASASAYNVGQSILINRPATTAWIGFMGMVGNAELDPKGTGCAASGGTCNWINTSLTAFQYDRVITAINGNQITLDAPIADSIDSSYVSGAYVNAFTFASRISQVGIENLRVIAPVPANNLVPPTASYQIAVTYAVLNGWIRNITAQDPLEAIDIENWGKQITVSNVSVTHTVTQTSSAKFEDFYVNGATQILMDSVADSTDNMFFFSTSSETQGPIVLRKAVFQGNTSIEPHQRWATGLLIENTTVSALSGSTPGAINLWDRGDYGSGQGWAIGWGTVWNSTAGSYTIQQPPGSENWCIGCVGTQLTSAAPGGSTVVIQGAIDSSGTYVFPTSLYQAQLTQRVPGAIAQ